jgi:hypothetical protein
MKKLLVLILVLGMASMANAALYITVNGEPAPPESEIILDVSDTIMLDISSDIDITPGGEGEGQAVLYAKTACATIVGGVPIPSHTDYVLQIMDAATAGVPIGADENGVFTVIFTFGEPIPAGTIFDEIIFHCESLNGPTPVILEEVDMMGNLTGHIIDQIVVHQIPEPATIVLLSLGGLLLRRRK